VTEYADPDLETIAPLPPVAPVPQAEPPAPEPSHSRSSALAVGAALVVVSLVVSFAVVTLVLNARDSDPAAVAVVPTPNVVDPQAGVLGGLILRQSDVPSGNTVQLLRNGADLTVATLDLCNGTFPSEQLRTARRQVALTHEVRQPNGLPPTSTLQLSTEAVLYGAPAGGAQAFRELRSVAATCPPTPVKSPVGEGTAVTTFRAAPDGAWPRTPTVERLAYDFVSVDAATGESTHSIAVYLRRGRILMGVYFAVPDGTQVPVDGKRSIAGIVSVFEHRIAQVPASVAGP